MAPAVCWMSEATPVLSCPPSPMFFSGQLVDGFPPTALDHVGLVSMRYWSRSYPGPEESARCTGSMAKLVDTPGTWFQFVIVPRKIPESVAPSRGGPPLRPGTL